MGIQASLFKDTYFILIRKQWLMFLNLAVFLISYTLSVYLKYPVLKFITASFGSFFILSLCFCYSRFLPKYILEKLGLYSLQLYLLQFFFIFPLEYLLKKMHIPGEFIVMGTFTVGLICPLLISIYIFPKSKVLSLLYGGLDRFSKA